MMTLKRIKYWNSFIKTENKDEDFKYFEFWRAFDGLELIRRYKQNSSYVLSKYIIKITVFTQ